MLPTLFGCAQIFKTSDYYMERSLAGLDPGDLRRRAGRANSILWTVGHVTVGRCRVVHALGGRREIPWVSVFGKGSSEVDGAEMPELAEVLSLWNELREELPLRLDRLDEKDLEAPWPYELPCSGQTVLGTITYFAFHEAYHLGQVSHGRKALGRGLARRTVDVVAARIERS
ncbi:DinB family protein [Sorangium sp. So ce1389]|uniref:DinB family protein n=1 Tax=Sorangium sp. So ce1389 TaxID=3133336 RepID=UPI003F61018C